MRAALLIAVLAVPLAARADSINPGIPLEFQPVPTLNADGGNHNLLGPTDMRFLPDRRMVIIEKSGVVKVRAVDGTISVAYRFCTLAGNGDERGLLGLEVDPQFN